MSHSEESRIQVVFDVSAVELTNELRKARNPRWPAALLSSNTEVVRIALRVLHAHWKNGSWAIGSDAATAQTFELPEGAAPAVDNQKERTGFDAKLAARDLLGLAALRSQARSRFGANGPEIARTALAHLRRLHGLLVEEVAVWDTSTSQRREVDLMAVANGSFLPQPSLQLHFDQRSAADDDGDAIRGLVPGESSLASRLFDIVLFVRAFNLELVRHVARVDRREPSLRGSRARASSIGPREQDVPSVESILAEYDAGKAISDMRQLRPLEPVGYLLGDLAARQQVGREAVARYLQHAYRGPSTFEAESGSTLRGRIASWRHWLRTQAMNGVVETEAPLPWQIVVQHELLREPGASRALLAHDTQQWLLDAFGLRHYRHNRALSAAVEALNTKFFGAPVVPAGRVHVGLAQRVSEDVLLDELVDAIASVPRQAEASNAESLGRAIYLVLVIGGFVRPVYQWAPFSEDIVSMERVLTSIELSELKSHVFSARTGLTGLNAILRGGVLPQGRAGRTWLIHGDHGAGKSSFALSVACDVASRGRFCVLLSTEERGPAIRDRTRVLGLENERYRLLDRAKLDRLVAAESYEDLARVQTELGISDRHGILVVISGEQQAVEFDLDSWLSDLRQNFARLRTLERVHEQTLLAGLNGSSDDVRRSAVDEAARSRRAQRRWLWHALVLDSWDSARWGEDRPPRLAGGPPRSARSLVSACETNLFWGIVTCAASHPDFEELCRLSDAVMEVRNEPGGAGRVLQVHKLRSQPYDTGSHPFHIREGRGVRIAPNLASVQRENQRRPRPALDNERGFFLPLNFSNSVANSGPGLGRPAILRGSWTLLTGPSHSGKGAFLFHMLRTTLRFNDDTREIALGPTGRLLVVSFRSNEREFMRRLVPDSRAAARLEESAAVFDVRWYSPGDQLRGASIIRELVERIRRSRLEDFVPIEVVVFDGIDALRANLPAVFADRSFWPTVFALLAGEEITTYFVTSDLGTDDDFVTRHRQDMDYVFSFRREDSSDYVATLARSPESGGAALFVDRRFEVDAAGTIVPSRPARARQRSGPAPRRSKP